LRTDQLAIPVVVAAIVAVVAIGADGGGSHGRGTVSQTRAVIAATITGITRDWAAGSTGYRTTRTTGYGSTRYRMRGACTSCIATAAMNSSSAAVDAPGMHAAATEAATSAAASIGIIGDQACGKQNDDCESSENDAEHDSNLPGNPHAWETAEALSARG
jgi:hypothetical protein